MIYLILSSYIIASISVTVYSSVNKLVEENILSNNSNIAISFIDNVYPGPWRIEGDKLYKGNHLLNEDYNIVDSIKDALDGDITIFLKDTRITTTIEDNGVRQIGTKASDQVIENVLSNGENYTGDADVVGIKYVTSYAPIYDESKEIIGMMFVGFTKAYVFAIIVDFLYLLLVVALGLLALGSLIFFFVIKRNIVKPINTLTNNLTEVSNLNLNFKIEEKLLNRKDEIGQMFTDLDVMVNNLRDITRDLSIHANELEEQSNSLASTSEEMAVSTEQVASSIDGLAESANYQMNDMSGISTMVNDLSLSIEEIEIKFKQVANEIENTEDKANMGKADMDNLMKSIEDIKTAFNIVENKVNNLNQSVINISGIADVIESIAEQTNLLALNAAIESARAGESGRGFAVVADEIRKLAEQSKKSTGEIINIIATIEKDTKEVMETSIEVTKYMENQSTSIDHTLSSFAEILNSVDNIQPIIEDTFNNISKIISMKEDTKHRVYEINNMIGNDTSAMQEVNASTEELTSSSEEVAATTETMNEMALELKNIVSKFKIYQ